MKKVTNHLERLDGDIRSVGVQLLFCTFVVISLSCRKVSGRCSIRPKPAMRTLKLESHAVRHALDTTTPELLVEFWVDTDVGCAHVFLGKRNDGL